MPGVADATFTEVLEIQVDSTSFVDGLAQLESAFDDFVERVNAKGFGAGNVIQVAQFADLQNQLQSLQGYLSEFDTEISSSMSNLDSKLTQVAEDAAKAGQAVVDAKAKAAQGGSGASGSDPTSGFGIGNISSFVTGLTGANNTLLEMLGNVTRFSLMWKAVGLAIDAVTAIIKAPFEVIQTGFAYLEQLQDATASLQGPIAANVKFSEDLATNFKLAGEAATQVEQSLEQMSISMGVPLEQLRKTFTDVLEAGGMHFESTLQGAINLTKELTVAVMATSTSAQGARLALAEIPKLLEGSMTGQSRILETLHMSTAEWNAMLAAAQKNGDLDLELADKLKPYLSVIDAAMMRQTALTEAVELQGQRIAGAIAMPLWQAWIGLLQQARTYLNENGEALAASGSAMVGLVTDTAEFARVVAGIAVELVPLEGFLHVLNGLFQGAVFLLRSLFDEATAGLKDVVTIVSFLLDGNKILNPAEWKKAWEQIVSNGVEASDRVKTAWQQGNDAIDGKGPVKTAGTNLLSQTVSPNSQLIDIDGEKKAKEQFTEMQEQYRTELDATKQKFRDVQDDINNAQQTGTISAEQAKDKRVAAYAAEEGAIDKLIGKYQDAAASSKLNTDSLDDKASAQVKKFQDQLNTEKSKDDRTGVQGQRAAEYKANEEAFQTIQDSYRNEIDKTKKAFEDSEKDIKSAQENGTISFRNAAEQRSTLIAKELTDIQTLVAKYTDLAQKSGANPQTVQKFVAGLSTVGANAGTDATAGQAANTAAEDKTEDEITQKHLAGLRAMEVQHAQAMLAIYKQEAADSLHSKTQVFDQEVKASKTEHDALIADLQADLVAAGNNASEQSAINDKIAAENQRYTDAHRNDTQQRIALGKQEVESANQNALKMATLDLQIQAAQDAGAKLHGTTTAQMVSDNQRLADAYVKLAQVQVQAAQSALLYAQVSGQDTQAINGLVEKLKEAEVALQGALNTKSEADSKSVSGQATQEIFGADNLSDAFSGFSRDVQSLASAMKFFSTGASNLISAIKSGYQSGGVMGAIGGAASSIGSLIPGIGGEIVSGVGSLFSFIGDLFTAAAKKVAKDVQDATSQLMEQYSNGQANLSQTIIALEAQRNQAIQTLSGMKDGQAQLNNLLPSLDSQIQSLLQTQTQTVTQFNNQAAALHLQSSTLSTVYTQWTEINQQVQQYIGAGGNVATAQQYLSDSLKQLATSTTSQIQQADQSAISDAQNLNQLLIQRVQLAQQYAQQEFGLKNGDSIERANNTALNAALTYQQQKSQDDQNLQNLDSQISLMTTRVSMESQVFSIAQSTADLQNQSNALNIEQLATQLQQYKDMQTVLNSIYVNTDGTYGVNNQYGLTAGTSGSSGLFPPAQTQQTLGPIPYIGNEQVTGNSEDAQFNDVLQQLNDKQIGLTAAISQLTEVMGINNVVNGPSGSGLSAQMAQVINDLKGVNVGLPNPTVDQGAQTVGSGAYGSSTYGSAGIVDTGSTSTNPSGITPITVTVQQLAQQIAAELGNSVTNPTGLAQQIAQQLTSATSGSIVPLQLQQPITATTGSQLNGTPGVPGNDPNSPLENVINGLITSLDNTPNITSPLTAVQTALAALQTAIQQLTQMMNSLTNPNAPLPPINIPPTNSVQPLGLVPNVTANLPTSTTPTTTVPTTPVASTDPFAGNAPAALSGATPLGASNSSLFDASTVSNLSALAAQITQNTPAPAATNSGITVNGLQLVVNGVSGDPTTIANSVYAELQNMGRYGTDTSY